MPRENLDVDLVPGEIRKRGCSSSASSSSSILRNYRLRRAVLVGKRGCSYTPVPTWRLISSRSRSPASQSGGRKSKQAPISARKLAATLWEINKIPSMEGELELDGRKLKKDLNGRVISAHSPVSERIDRYATSFRCRGTPSMPQNSKHRDHIIGEIDFSGEASMTEVEHRSKTPIPIVSTKARLTDISNALTTSKELVKIINRVWGHEHRPPSSRPLISALHAELERGRWQVNRLIQDHRSNQSDMNRPMKRFVEEKAAVEAAIEAVTGELAAERKLRRRLESFNKKLGRELAETKSAFLKLLKEHEHEKRAREIIEQVCKELARGIESKAAVQEPDEVDKNSLFWENDDNSKANCDAEKLRNQLEAVLGSKRTKQNINRSNYRNDVEVSCFIGRNHLNLHQIEDFDEGEVENRSECSEDSANSALHSVDSIVEYDTKNIVRDRRKGSINKETKLKKSNFHRRSREERTLWDPTGQGVGSKSRLIEASDEGSKPQKLKNRVLKYNLIKNFQYLN